MPRDYIGVSGIHRFFQTIQTDLEDKDSEEPAMILAKKVFGKGCAYVICLSSAYKFLEDDYLMRTAIKVSEVLCLTPATKAELSGIASMIMDGLDDLVSMPPAALTKKRDAAVFGEAEMNMGGQVFTRDMSH